MAERPSETKKFGTVEKPESEVVTVEMERLAFEVSEDLLPDVAVIISAVIEQVAPLFASGEIKGEDDSELIAMLPAFGVLAKQLLGGKLKQLSAKILSGTRVTMPDAEGELACYHLVKKEDRGTCFDLRPDLYLKILFYAGKGTFGPFFPVASLIKNALALAAKKKAAAKAALAAD